MDTSFITKRLYNKSVQWTWEAKEKGYDKVDSYYDKVAEVKKLSDMQGNPHIMTSGVGPQVLEEIEEKQPIKFVDPVEGYTVMFKRRDFSLGSETSMKLEDDMAIAGIENFFKKYIQENIVPSIKPTIDTFYASLKLNGGLLAGHKVFNNDTKNLATGYGNFLYDGKPPYALAGNEHPAKGHAGKYYNLLSLALTYDNARRADILLRSTNAYMENGQPFDMTKNLAIEVPTSLGDTAKEIFNSEHEPTSANNALNPLKGRYEIIENPYLNSQPTAWNLCKKKFGIVLFVNETPQIRYWVDESTRILKCSATITLAGGWYNFRHSVGSNYKTA